jgi:hypothetical protein
MLCRKKPESMIFKMGFNAQELNHPVLIRTHTKVKKSFAEIARINDIQNGI